MIARNPGVQSTILGNLDLWKLTVSVIPVRISCSQRNHSSLGFLDNQRLEVLCEERQLKWVLDRLQNLPTAFPTNAYISLLKFCGKYRTLSCAQHIHTHLVSQNLDLSGSLVEHLIMSLAKCGALDDALQVFNGSSYRSVFSWTAIISAYAEQGRNQDALTMYTYMQEDGIEPDDYTFVSLLKVCGNIPDLIEGKNIHSKLRKEGLETDVFVGTTLVSMYGKGGAIQDAEDVFMELNSRNVISWNAMLSAYVDHGQGESALQLFRQMHQEDVVPNCQTILVTIQACGILAERDESDPEKENKIVAMAIGQALHAYARTKRFATDDHVSNTLVSFYGKCGCVDHAENVFQNISKCSVIAWTALISSYVEGDQGKKALQSFLKMQHEGIDPNQQTFVSVLQACCILDEINEESIFTGLSWRIGQSLHADAQRKFYVLDVFVKTSLVGMYGKCAAFSESENMFAQLWQCTILQWNAMLSTYIEQGEGEKALLSYRQLIQEGMCPNQGTFVVTIQACTTTLEKHETGDTISRQLAKAKVHEIGRALHADIQRSGYASDLFIGTTLVNMYGKCGTISEAENVFSGLSEYNTVSWNAMISAYVDQGQNERALQIYEQLQSNQVGVNDITVISIMQACGETGCMEICQHLHFVITYAGYDSKYFVTSSLVNTYGCCASTPDAWAVFIGLSHPAGAACNACISGYAGEGDYMQSLQVFMEMQMTHHEPDGLTFTSLISACSHAGLVVKGIEFFSSISRIYRMEPDSKHYVGMVDLLGRAGDFHMVENFLQKNPCRADLSLWLCLLGACCVHGNVTLGKWAFENAVSLQPEESSAYVLMSNVYFMTGQWHIDGVL